MFEFGDELIIDSYRIPWLIWIQLFAMFLLVILVYYFTTTPSDLSTPSPSFVNGSILSFQDSKARENEIEAGTSTSEVVQRIRKPNVQRREGSSMTDEGRDMLFEHSHHPCNFFGVAKQAFLKCLGIDPTAPENSNKRRHEKND
uniref:uncharacterized protein LOC122605081 n=1 Tax=Erigeron canadensis TaxID=72917 RepID=UPI001CB96937|nr:uncharacterized protein LOC122605081 [Erigeron canadensis]